SDWGSACNVSKPLQKPTLSTSVRPVHSCSSRVTGAQKSQLASGFPHVHFRSGTEPQRHTAWTSPTETYAGCPPSIKSKRVEPEWPVLMIYRARGWEDISGTFVDLTKVEWTVSRACRSAAASLGKSGERD